MTRTRSYSELRQYETFEDRYEYLRMNGEVGVSTFGFDRWLNQKFYRSYQWISVRRNVIIRDNGCDLGIPGYEIYGGLLIHHMNPMTTTDILHGEPWLIDPEYLITTTQRTHNAIHYGVDNHLPEVVLARSANDTKLW